MPLLAIWGAITVLINTVRGIADISDSFYKGKKELEDEPRLVGNAKGECASQREELERYGLDRNEHFNRRQKEAESQVRKGEDRIRKKGKTKVPKDRRGRAESKKYIPNISANIAAALCPSKATQGRKTMDASVNAGPEFAKKRGEDRAAFQKEAQMCRPFASKPSSKDVLGRYVLLEETMKKVKQAWICSEKVVWLYGKVGTGKTGVLHELYRQLQEAPETSDSRQSLPKFMNIIFVDCGKNCNTAEKKKDILKYLGWRDEIVGVHVTTALRSAFAGDYRLLIMLDNLWGDSDSKNFLQELLDLSGKSVKFLVTSRERYEWKLNAHSNSERGACDPIVQGSTSTCSDPFPCIEIQKIGTQDARKIFTGHMAKGECVRNWADDVDKPIKQTGGNVLAIACLGASHEEWNQATVNPGIVAQRLKCEDTAYICSVKYPMSCWQALQEVFDNLTPFSQTLLLLVDMFEKPRCVEEVVQFLMKSMSAIKPGDFSKSRRELVGQGIVQISERRDEYLQIPGESCSWDTVKLWSIDPLFRLFLGNDDVIRTKKCKLAERGYNRDSNSETEEQDDRKCIQLVKILYLRREFTNSTASQEPIIHDKNHLQTRGLAIEPIIRLFQLATNREWTTTSYLFAIQLMVMYICDGKLHKSAILHLFSASLSCRAMWTALNQVLRLTSAITVSDGTINASALMNMFASKNALTVFRSYCPRMQAEIRRALVQIAGQTDEKTVLDLTIRKAFNWTGALDLLISLIIGDSTKLQTQDLCALANLSKGSLDISQKIVENSGAMKGLVNILSKSNNPDVRRGAAEVFVNLASHNSDHICTKIRESPGALDTLLGFLSSFKEPLLQVLTSFALAKLVPIRFFPARELQVFVGKLDKLVEALAADDNPCLQRNVARTLAKLARVCGKSLIPKAVDGLVTAFSKGNPGLQEYVAQALVSLTEGACGDYLVCNYEDGLPQVFEVLETAKFKLDLRSQTNTACFHASAALGRKVKLYEQGGSLPTNVKQQLLTSSTSSAWKDVTGPEIYPAPTFFKSVVGEL